LTRPHLETSVRSLAEFTQNVRITRHTGTRKVVDDSDDDEVVETKAPAPKVKAPSKSYVSLVADHTRYLADPTEGRPKHQKGSQRRPRTTLPRVRREGGLPKPLLNRNHLRATSLQPRPRAPNPRRKLQNQKLLPGALLARTRNEVLRFSMTKS
jgi:hypothetical protein